MTGRSQLARTKRARSVPGTPSPDERAVGAVAPGDPGAIPEIVWETLWAHARTSALETAVAIGLFDELVGTRRTAVEIARATKCSRRGVRMLADTLVALGFLSKAGERYELVASTRHFLVGSSPASVRGLVRLSPTFRRPFEHLTDVVRAGKPAPGVGEVGPSVYPELVSALFPSSFAVSRLAREAVPARVRSRVKRVLDVAAGSAAWSLAWAVADAEVHVTALDFADVLDVTRQYTDAFGCRDRYEFVDGNLRTGTFGKDRFDLVILGQICHAEGARGAKRLIAKSADALVEGGTLVVADMIPSDKRTGPPRHLLFALNLLVGTTDGDVFTFAEFRDWMLSAGLSSVRELDLGSDACGVIVGTKRGGSRQHIA
jgi:hypothetical protein